MEAVQLPAGSSPVFDATILETAVPYIKAARAALDSISKRDLTEMKMYKVPPRGLEDVFNACFLLIQAEAVPFNKIESLSLRRKMEPASFLSDLHRVAPRIESGSIPEANIASVQRLVEGEYFDPDRLKKMSGSASALAAFVINVVHYYEILRQARLSDEVPPAEAAPLTEDLEVARAEGARRRAPPVWTRTQANPEWASVEHQAAALAAAMDDGVQLIDAGYLATLADAGGIVPRYQDLEAAALVSRPQMELWRAGHSLAVLVLSYCWLAADHPDPAGHTLRSIAFVLRAFATHAKARYGEGCRVGVFWDYLSMPQRSRGCAPGEDDRSEAEVAIFTKGLRSMNAFYVHAKTYTLLVNRPPPAEAATARPYDGRGWCVAERAMASMVKSTYCLLDMSRLDGTEADCNELVIKAAADRATTVVSPPAFRAWLLGGVGSGQISFTHATDAALVADIYAAAFLGAFTTVVEMRYDQTGMGDADACSLAASLVHAHELGALAKLELLDLSFNRIGDKGCAALAQVLGNGAMPNLQSLRLRGNAIDNDGMAALAQALGRVPDTQRSLRDVRIGGNPASERSQEQVQAATKADVFIGSSERSGIPFFSPESGGPSCTLL